MTSTPPPKGRLTEALVDAQYPDFRSKYEFLAQRFRDLLGTPGSYLYIYREIVTQTDARRLAALLGARSPEHRFQFLFVDVKGAVNQVLTDVGVPTVKGWLPADCDKAADRQWEGPDAAWDAVLGRFDLGLHGLHTPAGLALTQADAIVGPSGRPPAKGWRTLLATHGADTFLRDFSFADSAGVGRHLVDDDRAAFAHPLPDDHFYCQFLRAGLDGQPGWARVTFDWGADGTRASVGLQDQDCRHPRALSLIEKPLRSGHRQVMILPLDSDVEQLRLVAMPTGNGRSVLPSRMTLEVVPDAPARAPTIWARLFGRRA
jgi:hypothetical protein